MATAAEKARLARLRRLERVRAIAKQAAALESAEAESTLAQLRALAERTRTMAAGYGEAASPADGAGLAQRGRFVAGLHTIARQTEGDAGRAQAIADAKMRLLAESERRRAAVDDRARIQARQMTRTEQMPALGTRRASGTGLE